MRGRRRNAGRRQRNFLEKSFSALFKNFWVNGYMVCRKMQDDLSEKFFKECDLSPFFFRKVLWRGCGIYEGRRRRRQRNFLEKSFSALFKNFWVNGYMVCRKMQDDLSEKFFKECDLSKYLHPFFFRKVLWHHLSFKKGGSSPRSPAPSFPRFPPL